MVGGASIYPFVWNILLAARAEGLRGVITSVAVRREDEVRRLFSIPETFAVAALVVLGRPASAPSRLRRRPVGEFTWIDRFEGPELEGSS
jgi:nitroreductase